MSKAILVIDMPESCSKCPLFNGYYADMSCGGLSNRGINYPYPEDFKQDWCPLKPMPQYKASYTCSEEFLEWCQIGYNECIDEILGGNT